jgi:hypothetical protein
VVLPPYRTELYVHVILVSVCQDYLQGLPDSLVGARLVFPVQGYLSSAHVSKKNLSSARLRQPFAPAGPVVRAQRLQPPAGADNFYFGF